MAVGRVLVADDETHIVQVLALKFRNAGLEVIEARDGEEALALVHSESPDVVVTDLQMPFMDGAALAAAMAADPSTAQIPVLVLTARGWSMDGALETLPNVRGIEAKPFSPRALLLRVQGLIKDTRSQGASGDRAAA